MKKFLLILFLLSSLISFSQEIKFGEVSKEELKATHSKLDSTAGAEILYINKDIYYEPGPYGYQLITEIHKRIKFYDTNDEDLQHATIVKYLYKKNRKDDEISRIKGYTFNLVDNKIQQIKLDRSEIFEKSHNDNFNKVSFTMPDIKKGSIIDIRYKISSPYFTDLDEINLQYTIPLRKLHANLTVPSNIIFKKYGRGEHSPTVTSDKNLDRRINLKTTTYHYSIENVPALKEEKFVGNIENYRSAMFFEISAIRYADGTGETFSNSWGDVARVIATHDDYEYEIKKDRIFREELENYLNNEQDSLKRLTKVLEFAKKNISWDKKYGYGFMKSIRRAFKEKTGSVADINLSLVSMLRYAGFEATPIVLATTHIARPVFPTINHLNYVIAYVEIENKKYYLDATDLYSEPNILPYRVYNYLGLFVDTENKIWKQVDIQNPPLAKKINLINVELDKKFGLSGNIKEVVENHYAYNKRKKYYSQSENEYLREKEKKISTLEISNYNVSNIENTGKIVEEYNYQLQNGFSKIGDEIIINPLFFLKDFAQNLPKTKRKYPLKFSFPYDDKTIVNIKIPEGYKIKEMPSSLRLNYAQTIGSYKYIVNSSKRFIRITINEKLNQTLFPANQYKELKSFFDNISQVQDKPIILEKV